MRSRQWHFCAVKVIFPWREKGKNRVQLRITCSKFTSREITSIMLNACLQYDNSNSKKTLPLTVFHGFQQYTAPLELYSKQITYSNQTRWSALFNYSGWFNEPKTKLRQLSTLFFSIIVVMKMKGIYNCDSTVYLGIINLYWWKQQAFNNKSRETAVWDECADAFGLSQWCHPSHKWHLSHRCPENNTPLSPFTQMSSSFTHLFKTSH